MSEAGAGPPTAWVAGCAAAQAALDADVAGLTDAVAHGPSRLPGWSVGHVLTHLARNADSVVWRLEGAAEGAVRDQYPGGPGQRQADIDAGAGRPAAALVADVARSSAAVEQVMAALGERPGTPRHERRAAWSSRHATWCSRAGARWWCITATSGSGWGRAAPAGPRRRLAPARAPAPGRAHRPGPLLAWIIGRGDPPELAAW